MVCLALQLRHPPGGEITECIQDDTLHSQRLVPSGRRHHGDSRWHHPPEAARCEKTASHVCRRAGGPPAQARCLIPSADVDRPAHRGDARFYGRSDGHDGPTGPLHRARARTTIMPGYAHTGAALHGTLRRMPTHAGPQGSQSLRALDSGTL